MTENLQLENLLATRLREIDFPIGERVYFEDYARIAREEDEVNRMLSMPTAEDIREGVENGNLYEKLVAKLGREQVEAVERRLKINMENMLEEMGMSTEFVKEELRVDRFLALVFAPSMLSEAQMVVDSEYKILFRREGYKQPWKVQYEVAEERFGYGEMIDIQYKGEDLFHVCNRPDGTMDVDIDQKEAKLLYYPAGIYRMVKHIEGFHLNRFDPEIIVDTVVGLVSGED